MRLLVESGMPHRKKLRRGLGIRKTRMRETMPNKTCETCLDNDSGLCDRKGILIEDEDSCEKHRGKDPTWKEAVMRTFLAGH